METLSNGGFAKVDENNKLVMYVSPSGKTWTRGIGWEK
jgi:hypothetical protein